MKLQEVQYEADLKRTIKFPISIVKRLGWGPGGTGEQSRIPGGGTVLNNAMQIPDFIKSSAGVTGKTIIGRGPVERPGVLPNLRNRDGLFYFLLAIHYS